MVRCESLLAGNKFESCVSHVLVALPWTNVKGKKIVSAIYKESSGKRRLLLEYEEKLGNFVIQTLRIYAYIYSYSYLSIYLSIYLSMFSKSGTRGKFFKEPSFLLE
jgi:hypothetical protein